MRWMLLVSLLVPALADNLFGTTGRNGANSHLYRISTVPTSGGQLIGRDLGPILVDNRGVTISGMAFDRRNRVLGGTMFAIVAASSNYIPNFLIEIDLETAIGTKLGIGLSRVGVRGLAISNVGDIYGWHQGSVRNDPIDILLKIDDDTGLASSLEPSGLDTFDSASENAMGMDFDRVDDTTIHFLRNDCDYFTLSTADGVATKVTSLGNGDSFQCGSATVNPDSSRSMTELWSLDVDLSLADDANTLIRIYDIDSLEIVQTYQTTIDNLETIACKCAPLYCTVYVHFYFLSFPFLNIAKSPMTQPRNRQCSHRSVLQ